MAIIKDPQLISADVFGDKIKLNYLVKSRKVIQKKGHPMKLDFVKENETITVDAKELYNAHCQG